MTIGTIASTDPLVEALDSAVQADSTVAVADNVQNVLTDFLSNGKVSLPKEMCEPREECYARRLIHRSERFGYDAIAMIWGPAQGTPLHDHAGIWCVEGVFCGEIEVVQYDLVEQSGDFYRFEAQDAVQAHVGMAGSLIPPYEYHTIRNAVQDAPSITIHVYGSGMDHCCCFEPEDGGWFRKVDKALAFHD